MDLIELRRRGDRLCGFMKENPNAGREEIRSAISRHFSAPADFEVAINDLMGQVSDIRDLIDDKLDQLQELCGCAENDVEGAALAIYALNVTHSNHEDDDYQEEANLRMGEHCSLLRVHLDCPDFPVELEFRVEEMLDMIFDGAERMEAECPAFKVA